jgi:arylsulfatase A-like enzyme
MPTVRRMQRGGVTFDDYVVTDSLCCPSRATILTGEYPHNHGVVRNTGWTGGWEAFRRLGAEERSVAVGLEEAGYRTGMFGKYLNLYRDYTFVPPGWSDWFVSAAAYDQFAYTASVNGVARSFGQRPRSYNTDVLTRRAVGFIDSATRKRQPFFAYVAPFAPHNPAIGAPRYRRRFHDLRLPRDPTFGHPIRGGASWSRRGPLDAAELERMTREYRRRARSVLALDDLLAAVWKRLRENGQAKRTYLVFSSDNGYHMGHHNLTSGKASPYDTDVRVPLVMVGPGLPAGRHVSALAANIDLAPTFRAMAGLGPSPTVDGRSLLGLATGRRSHRGWRPAVLLEHASPEPRRSDPDAQSKSAGSFPAYQALRTRTGTYVRYETGEREYFDRVEDPWELRNSVARLPVLEVPRLDAALDRYAGCRGAGDCGAAAQAAVASPTLLSPVGNFRPGAFR